MGPVILVLRCYLANEPQISSRLTTYISVLCVLAAVPHSPLVKRGVALDTHGSEVYPYTSN